MTWVAGPGLSLWPGFGSREDNNGYFGVSIKLKCSGEQFGY